MGPATPRQQSASKAVTYGQIVGVRHEQDRGALFIDWLHQQGSALAGCTQDQIDAWLDEGAHHRTLIRSFLF